MNIRLVSYPVKSVESTHNHVYNVWRLSICSSKCNCAQTQQAYYCNSGARRSKNITPRQIVNAPIGINFALNHVNSLNDSRLTIQISNMNKMSISWTFAIYDRVEPKLYIQHKIENNFIIYIRRIKIQQYFHITEHAPFLQIF